MKKIYYIVPVVLLMSAIAFITEDEISSITWIDIVKIILWLVCAVSFVVYALVCKRSETDEQ